MMQSRVCISEIIEYDVIQSYRAVVTHEHQLFVADCATLCVWRAVYTYIYICLHKEGDTFGLPTRGTNRARTV